MIKSLILEKKKSVRNTGIEESELMIVPTFHKESNISSQ